MSDEDEQSSNKLWKGAALAGAVMAGAAALYSMYDSIKNKSNIPAPIPAHYPGNYEISTVNKINILTSEVKEICKNIPSFEMKDINHYKGFFQQKIIELDCIDSKNNPRIRQCKKNAMTHMATCMEMLEEKKKMVRASSNPSASVNVSYEDQTMKKIKNIAEDIQKLRKEVEDVNFNCDLNKYQELLFLKNLELDNIDVKNNNKIRDSRKLAIVSLQTFLEVIDMHRNNREQPSTVNNLANDQEIPNRIQINLEASENPSASVNVSYEDQTMEIIKNIFENIQELRKEVENVHFNCDLNRYQELLFQKNLELDNIDVKNNKKIRDYRKLAIVYLQTFLEVIDMHRNNKEQPSTAASVANDQDMLNRMDRKEDECAVCCESLKTGNLIITDCNHQFHYKCLKEWLEKDDSCPLCREEVEL